MKIAKECVVGIDYTLTDDHGEVIDSSKDNGVLTYLHGMGNLIKGLEDALEGKSAGESFKVSIPPAEAYGDREASRLIELPKSRIEGSENLEAGMEFVAESDEGKHVVRVAKIEGEKVTIDTNHPLAGKILHFDVAIMEVRPATEEELAHGHVHGPDGHH